MLQRCKSNRPGAGILAVTGGLVFTSLTLACNVPVFRYALERWQPEEYEAVIFHRGPLEPDAQDLVKALDQSDKKVPANLTLRKVDLADQLDSPTQKIWQQQTNAVLPWLVLRYAPGREEPLVIWTGRLEEDLRNTLIDSPARRGITQRLTNGQTAVWLFLEGGTQVQDDTALDILADTLKKQEKTLQLPEPAPDDPQMHSALPLRVEFSIVRVARNNPAEQFLVSMLLAGDEQLLAATRPIAFPVFGRGRVLAALSGKELSADIIGEACAFICGPCSCEIKEQNPGRDLLLAADWDTALEGQPASAPITPALTGMSQFAAPPTNPPATNAAPTPTPQPAVPSRLVRNLALALGSVVLALAIGTLALRLKGGKRQN